MKITISNHVLKTLCHRIALVVGVIWVTGWPPAQAGWIEALPDKTVIHVKVFQLPDPASTVTSVKADAEVVKLFRARFPEIFAARYRAKYLADPAKYGRYNWDRVEIKLEQATGIRVAGVEGDLLAIAGGLAPDVLYINFRKSDTYIRNGFLYPLDEYIATIPAEEFALRVHPRIRPVMQRKGPNGEKHDWTLPFGGVLGRVLLYRKDLFDAHDIPYPDKNWTWEDMLAASKKITDPTRGISGMRLLGGGWAWLTWLWSAGGDVMQYDEAADQWRCVFGSRAGAVALDFFTRLATEKWVDANGKIRRGYGTLETTEQSPKWGRGEIGMMLTHIDEQTFTAINPEVTGMAPVPLGPPNPVTGQRQRGGELNSQMMGLFSQIESPAVRDAAWEYMRFFDGPEALAVKTRVQVENGYGPFVNPKYLRMFGYEEALRLAPPEWAETFEIAINSGYPEPYGKNSNLAYRMMGEPVDQVLQMSIGDQLPRDPEERLAVIQGILEKAEVRANEEMIQLIPPGERTKRRTVAAIVLAGIVVGFGYVFRRIIKAFTPPASQAGAVTGWQFRKYKWAYLLVVPAALTILVWQYVPLMSGSMMAFTDYKLLGQSPFVGVDNFGNLLFDNHWWQAVWNAARYSLLVVGLTFLPPIVLAVLLQEVPRGKLLFRTIYYLPAVVSGPVTVLLWKMFYDPSDRGALNAVILRIPAIGFVLVGAVLLVLALLFARRLWLQQLNATAWGFVAGGVVVFLTCSGMAKPILFPAYEGLLTSLQHLPGRLFTFTSEPYRWLSDPDTAMLACVIPMVWAGMGPGCLIYLAALKGIPDDYYEAADLDGANFIDQILFVVFPTLKVLVIINFVGVFVGSWHGATGRILMMTAGQANTETAGLYIWYKAFTFLQFGPATAAAWMLGFMLIGFTVNQLRILSRVEFQTTGAKK